jgi:hypothetical protein
MNSDKNLVLPLILPKEQMQIDDLMMLSTYLTESLILEMERVKASLTY